MQDKSVRIMDRCVVVMLRRPEIANDAAVLERAIRKAAVEEAVPETLFALVPAMADNDERFLAWNIGHPGLLRELFRLRESSVVKFRAYYRPCSGDRIFSPEGNFFEGF